MEMASLSRHKMEPQNGTLDAPSKALHEDAHSNDPIAVKPNDPKTDPNQDLLYDTTAADSLSLDERGRKNHTNFNENNVENLDVDASSTRKSVDAHSSEFPRDRTGYQRSTPADIPNTNENANDGAQSEVSRFRRMANKLRDRLFQPITQKLEVTVPRESSMVRIVSPPHPGDPEKNLVYNIQSRKFSVTEHFHLKSQYSKLNILENDPWTY